MIVFNNTTLLDDFLIIIIWKQNFKPKGAGT